MAPRQAAASTAAPYGELAIHRSRTACKPGNRADSGTERRAASSNRSLASCEPELRRRLELPSAHLIPYARTRYPYLQTALSESSPPLGEERPPLVDWDARLKERDFEVIDGLIASARDGFPPPFPKREPLVARPAEYFERAPSHCGAFKWRPPELYCHSNSYNYDYIW